MACSAQFGVTVRLQAMFSAMLGGQCLSLSRFDFFLSCKGLQDLEIIERSADVGPSIEWIHYGRIFFGALTEISKFSMVNLQFCPTTL